MEVQFSTSTKNNRRAARVPSNVRRPGVPARESNELQRTNEQERVAFVRFVLNGNPKGMTRAHGAYRRIDMNVCRWNRHAKRRLLVIASLRPVR